MEKQATGPVPGQPGESSNRIPQDTSALSARRPLTASLEPQLSFWCVAVVLLLLSLTTALCLQAVLCPMDQDISKIIEPCTHIALDVDKFVKPKDFIPFKTHHGLEDARAVSYNGRVFLVGTVNRW